MRHLEAEKEAEQRHGADWKELAIKLTERGLLFRELPPLVEAAGTEEGAAELSLEEVERELQAFDMPVNFSAYGELGRRRELVAQRERLRRNMDLRSKGEMATEAIENTFGPGF